MEDDMNWIPVFFQGTLKSSTSLPAFCKVIWADSCSHVYSETFKCGAFLE